MSVQRSDERNFGLDLLRCVAIAIVLGNHALVVVVFGIGGVPRSGALALASLGAYLSIEWLFVLSGFLIGAILIRSVATEGASGATLRRFWLRRWLRTLPAYYLFVGVNLLVRHAGMGEGRVSWAHLCFTQNLLGAERTPIFFPESWSLAVDEWFYLLLPLLVAGAMRRLRGSTRAAFLAATAVLILVPTVARVMQVPPRDVVTWDYAVRRVTLYHLDATGWGVMAVAASRWWPTWWRARIVRKLVAGVTLTALGASFYARLALGGVPGDALARLGNPFGIGLIAAGTALCLAALTRLPAPGPITRRAVAAISDYTYAAYLCHLPLLVLGASRYTNMARAAPGAFLSCWVAGVVLTSAFVFHVVERPIHRLRDRLTGKVAANPF